MGRSDTVLFPTYSRLLGNQHYDQVAFLGFSKPNVFTNSISANECDFFDLGLNNWNINSQWDLKKKYDLIVSTRCPYFAKDPRDFLIRCHDSLRDGGVLLADWGLGDHWRFDNFKVGWVKDGEHEHCYGDTNFLWSYVWHDSFLEDPQVKLFISRIKKFGYDGLRSAIFDEVPVVLDLDEMVNHFDMHVLNVALWEDSPQLYTMLRCTKK